MDWSLVGMPDAPFAACARFARVCLHHRRPFRLTATNERAAVIRGPLVLVTFPYTVLPSFKTAANGVCRQFFLAVISALGYVRKIQEKLRTPTIIVRNPGYDLLFIRESGCPGLPSGVARKDDTCRRAPAAILVHGHDCLGLFKVVENRAAETI
jgi:hypothetical protein